MQKRRRCILSEQNPILDGYVMGEALTDHNGVVCYPAMPQNGEDKYIVKKIQVPASSVLLDALLLTGAYSSRESALEYYRCMAEDILQECKLLSELSKLEGFVSYQSSQITEIEDGSGFYVSLIAPYRQSLEQIFSEQIMTHQGIVDLAMDLCTALAACRRAGYLYIDLKPSNIFYTDGMEHRIGDLGFVSLASLRFASLQDKYRSVYTPPEIEDAMSQLNTTLDVYALGLILYQAYNGGQLPLDDGHLPESLLPPQYADYEMAEIILKACCPDPANRWADPTQFGQALIQYLHRNGVPEGPIIPAPVSTPELDVGEEFLPDEETIAQEEWDAINELDIFETLDSTDETEAPATEEARQEEMAEILAQADELIAHVLPEPAVAPEPIEVPIPAPIVLEPDPIPEEIIEETEAVDDSDPVVEEESEKIEEAVVAEIPLTAEADSAAAETPEEQNSMIPEETTEDATAETEDLPQPPMPPLPASQEKPIPAEEKEAYPAPIKEKIPHPKRKMLLRMGLTVLVLLLLGTFIVSSFRNYQDEHKKMVHELTLHCTADSISVYVRADVPESELRITCSDTYGNTLSSKVLNGNAIFTGLMPQTRYTIRVTTIGNYQLNGIVTDTITTASQTVVSDLAAVLGPSDGSAYITFQVNGVECDEWILTWSAPNVEPQSTTFTGHSCTVYDLMIGKNYTFTLSAGDDCNVIGETEIQYTAARITRAQNPMITACGNGSLTVIWEPPADVDVAQWTVRCRDNSGYDVTITTSDLTATFDGLTHATACNVEITAEGMTQSVFTSVCANPINVESFTLVPDGAGNLLVSWDYTGTAPDGGWSISWSCDGSQPQFQETMETQLLLPFVPGGHYTFSLIPADDTDIFGHTQTVTAPEAEKFNGFGITADQLQLTMCATPETPDWHWNEVQEDDFRTMFTNGETAGFVVWCSGELQDVAETVMFSFVIRDAQDKLISFSSTEAIWNTMWDQGFYELNIPKIPQAPGEYSVMICLNGQFLATQIFQIH